MSTPVVAQPAIPSAIFTSSFYEPYRFAAQRALELLCAARSTMPPDSVSRITYRLKTPGSIRRKLAWRGLSITKKSAGTLTDIAGLRVVLKEEADCYRFAALLQAAPSVRLLMTRDYIAAPKRSGYRSLHLILLVPVMNKIEVPVEIQLRTQEMDDWAQQRHDVEYKPVGEWADE